MLECTLGMGSVNPVYLGSSLTHQTVNRVNHVNLVIMQQVRAAQNVQSAVLACMLVVRAVNPVLHASQENSIQLQVQQAVNLVLSDITVPVVVVLSRSHVWRVPLLQILRAAHVILAQQAATVKKAQHPVPHAQLALTVAKVQTPVLHAPQALTVAKVQTPVPNAQQAATVAKEQTPVPNAQQAATVAKEQTPVPMPSRQLQWPRSRLLCPCPAGSYSADGAASCLTCDAQYHCPGGTDKIPCAPGAFSNPGAVSCAPCLRNVSSEAAWTQLTDNDINTFVEFAKVS